MWHKMPCSHVRHIKSGFKVMWGQVWWPILRICVLHLTHTHTHTHTHTVNTHPEQWAGMCAEPKQLWVQCLAQGHLSHGIEGEEGAVHSLPPTYNSCQTRDSNPQPSGYKSDSLSIRPRLPQRQNKFIEGVLLVCQETRCRSVAASCRSRNDWQWTHLNCFIYQTCKCLGKLGTHNGALFISLTEDTARTGSADIIRDCPGKQKRRTTPDIEARDSSLMSEACKAMLSFPSRNPQSHMPNMFAFIEPCSSQTRRYDEHNLQISCRGLVQHLVAAWCLM